MLQCKDTLIQPWTTTGTGIDTAVTASDNLEALQEAEKAAGIEPDPHVAAFMKANTLEGKAESIHTEFILHILGLNVCADTMVSLKDFQYMLRDFDRCGAPCALLPTPAIL